MTSVAGTTASRALAQAGTQAATKPAGAMDQSHFLRLMTTQLTTSQRRRR